MASRRAATLNSSRYLCDDSRWKAVQTRDPAADQAFVYCVRTTKIFCRPICKARLARRANVEFFATSREAQKAGYRACKRCKPEVASGMPAEDGVKKILELVARSSQGQDIGNMTLETMAKNIGLSKWHFHRVFTKVVGQTPSQYALSCRTASSSATPSSGTPSSAATPSSQFDNSAFDLALLNNNFPSPLSLDNFPLESTWDKDLLSEDYSDLFQYDSNSAAT